MLWIQGAAKVFYFCLQLQQLRDGLTLSLESLVYSLFLHTYFFDLRLSTNYIKEYDIYIITRKSLSPLSHQVIKKFSSTKLHFENF